MPIPPAHAPRGRPLVHAFILSYLAIQLLLMARCYVAEAKFFGWQMFSHGLIYRMRLRGIGADGRSRPIELDAYRRWLTGYGRNYFGYPGHYQIFGRGEGFLLSELRRLPAYLCGKLAAEGYDRIELTVEHHAVTERAVTQETIGSNCEG